MTTCSQHYQSPTSLRHSTREPNLLFLVISYSLGRFGPPRPHKAPHTDQSPYASLSRKRNYAQETVNHTSRTIIDMYRRQTSTKWLDVDARTSPTAQQLYSAPYAITEGFKLLAISRVEAGLESGSSRLPSPFLLAVASGIAGTRRVRESVQYSCKEDVVSVSCSDKG